MQCKWNFCSVPFTTSSELHTHLQSTHIAYEKAEEVPHKRRRLAPGAWFVLRDEPLSDRLFLRHSQTTGGDITTSDGNTTFTTHPLPPSFPSLPPSLPSQGIPLDVDGDVDTFLNFNSPSSSPNQPLFDHHESASLAIESGSTGELPPSQMSAIPSQPPSTFDPPTQPFATGSTVDSQPSQPSQPSLAAKAPSRHTGPSQQPNTDETAVQTSSESCHSLQPSVSTAPTTTSGATTTSRSIYPSIQPTLATTASSSSTTSAPLAVSAASVSVPNPTSKTNKRDPGGFAVPIETPRPTKEGSTISNRDGPTSRKRVSSMSQSLPSPRLSFGSAAVKNANSDSPGVQNRKTSGENVGFAWGEAGAR